MDFGKVIESRYSCKSYSDRMVPEDVLKGILEAGRLAPTAKNLQEQKIYVATRPETLSLIDASTPCRYGAPCVLVVCFDNTNVYTYPDGKRQSGIEDASIVATHVMLAAADAGVDSCWVNCFHHDRLHQALALPDNEEILMLMDLGYRSEKGTPLPNHFSRKPLSDTVEYL